MDTGIPSAEPLRRMSSHLALRQAQKFTCWKVRESEIWRRFGLLNMLDMYPNPAARFASSVKLQTKLNKLIMELAYDAIDARHGVSFVFRKIDSLKPDRTSLDLKDSLYVGEEAFSFIFPFIKRHVDNSFNYYRLENPLAYEVWEKIIIDMRKTACLILHNPASPEIVEILQDASTYIFYSKNAEFYYMDLDRHIRENRKTLYAFYNYVCDWLEDNLSGEDSLINIEGFRKLSYNTAFWDVNPVQLS